MDGILLCNKPTGMTSHDVIAIIKRTLHIDKIGHAGTLDPLATGLLVVLLGQATKLSDYLMNDNKRYLAEITLGIATDTEDITGNIIESKDVEEDIDVDNVLDKISGKIMQTPPMYSSIHHNGQKLYEIARKGITVDRVAREVNIKEMKKESEVIKEGKTVKFSFSCLVSKGTYIRTLCTEIGTRLGYPATMSKLCRTSSGDFSLDNAYSLEDIKKGNYKLLNMIDCLSNKFTVEVNDELAKKILNGMKLYEKFENELIFFTYKNELLAVYERDNNCYRARRVWN